MLPSILPISAHSAFSCLCCSLVMYRQSLAKSRDESVFTVLTVTIGKLADEVGFISALRPSFAQV